MPLAITDTLKIGILSIFLFPGPTTLPTKLAHPTGDPAQ